MPDYEHIAEQAKSIEPEPEAVVVPSEKAAQILSEDRTYLPASHEKYQGIATERGYKQGEDYHRSRLQKVRYSHEAMIDFILLNPTCTQKQIALEFGVTENWISVVHGSDSFQAALAKRRDDLLDPEVVASIEERFKGAVHLSLNVITEKLETSRNTDLALKTLDVSIKALGFGARTAPGTQNNQYIIQLPPKAESSEAWNATHNPRGMKQLPSSEA